ncbi:MAG TPA: gamma carbonic anhydrase family protein [Azospirillum sp.]|nr:gamma carbonic anhydrase family protein [Azospirillum sp.]
MSNTGSQAAGFAARYPGAIIRPFRGVWPRIAESAFVAPGAAVIGDVEIGADSGVWYGCVLRGDDHSIRVGERTNIQDGTMVHVTLEEHATVIGSGVTIGHGVRLHGCTLEDGCLVGIGAIVLDAAVVEREAMVAGGAVVTPRKRVLSRQLWGGSPARYMRDLTPADVEFLSFDAGHYVKLAREYREG